MSPGDHGSEDGGVGGGGRNNSESTPGLWATIKMAYQGLVHTVIRPPRSRYTLDDLGPTTCIFAHNLIVTRQDFTLRNTKGLAVECSWWKPKGNSGSKMPCIVVLHGNSSSRLGCMETLVQGLAAGFSVCAIDFSGSGLSEGKYVSLGYHEKNDIHLVLQHLVTSNQVSNIILWGRSMGAVASILCAAEEDREHIAAMVLDSPFASLKRVAMDLVDDGKLHVPKFAVSIVLRFVRRDIQRRAKFDMFQLRPKAVIHECAVPSFFAVGEQDELVKPTHVELLHKLHRGPKQMCTFPGGHNSIRPPEFYHRAINFCRVMCGLLPLPDVQLDDRRLSPVQVRYSTPLDAGLSIDAVRVMSIRQLKDTLLRLGLDESDFSAVVEKDELVHLVMKFQAKQVRMRTNSDESENKPPTAPPLSPQNSSPMLVRRHSTGTDDPPTCPDQDES
ncbi:hypothetical protein LEN26_010088 [Aphanomyces euteiches]|nr:hypothetical protein AeMF1_009263 [Aphanomyces euteiches]KAH9122788.1 hypothetical protein LEN26_010088 [Aphanomyces euteiches]